MVGFQNDGSSMFKHTGFFNLMESYVLSIPHSIEQRGNPTKASGTRN